MAVATGEHARRSPDALPAELTSLIGRQQEVADLKRMLPEARCVTLTGTGGVGKTRLALRVASEARRTFKNNVWLIDLGELREATLLTDAVKEKLNLHEQAASTALEAILDHLSDQDAVLVVDNCEHVVDECVSFVSVLLRSCPRVHVLCTSRQTLGFPGEAVYEVSPLPVPPAEFNGESGEPTAEALLHYPAAQLFLERARTVSPELELATAEAGAVARMCRHLDGLPLAVELAAANVRTLSPAQIEQRLGAGEQLPAAHLDGPQRHRTLRDLIDWSYELCTGRERLLWERASVFSGTFDLDAAEYVTGDDALPAADTLDLIHSLVDKSILTRHTEGGNARYRLLEPLREFGQERLAETREQRPVTLRHRDWYASLASRFAAEWIGPGQAEWIARLRREHPNLRTALESCATDPDDARTGLRMTVDLEDYWATRGLHTEARRWLDRMLRASPGNSAERLSGLRLGSWFALLQGDAETSQALLTAAAELADPEHDLAETAYLSHVPGMGALYSGNLDQAETLLGDALSRFRAAGVPRGELFSQFMLGLTLGLRGEPQRGMALINDCADTATTLGDEYWQSWAHWAAAHIQAIQENLDDAQSAGVTALRLQHRLDNMLGMVFALATLAWVAERRQQHVRAATLFGAGEAIFHAIGTKPSNYAPFAIPHEQHLTRTREALGYDVFERNFRTGYDMPVDAAVDYALESRAPAGATPAGTGPSASGDALTPREREVAELITQGLSNKDLAKKLLITQRTAEGHVQHILTKLDLRSRTQIATWVMENDPPDAG